MNEPKKGGTKGGKKKRASRWVLMEKKGLPLQITGREWGWGGSISPKQKKRKGGRKPMLKLHQKKERETLSLMQRKEKKKAKGLPHSEKGRGEKMRFLLGWGEKWGYIHL